MNYANAAFDMHMDDPVQSGSDTSGYHENGVASNKDLPDKEGPYYVSNSY